MDVNFTIPGSILASSTYIMEHAKDVTIDNNSLQTIAGKIEERLTRGADDIEQAFGSSGVLEQDINIIFFETACNFCFWSQDTNTKWKVEQDGKGIGGWYGLATCFDRALKNNVPVYDATWMAQLTVEAARELFAGTGSQIPLLEQRVNNIVEMANFLVANYDGQASNFVRECSNSAPRIAKAVTENLPSFRDGALYDGRWIWILKRAQILPSDLSQLTAKYPEFVIKDCNELTAFADYRLPQILRHYGALAYSEKLANTIDKGVILPAGSPAEIEIRAATIIACEQLKQHLPSKTSADIDLGLWLISQDMRGDPELKPHHYTPGYFY